MESEGNESPVADLRKIMIREGMGVGGRNDPSLVCTYE
jgi:hypothetical protein